ncbi:MAG: SgcJ/EcaC family oxidoreductase, partial [Planctomycetia bacterium]
GSMNVVKTGGRAWRQRAEWMVLAAVLQAGGGLAAEVQSVVVPARAAETVAADAAASPEFEALIRRELEATVKAFNAADAGGLAALFMEKGELVDENGNVYRGREEIAALFKAFFTKFPKAELAMEVTAVRSVGDSLAVEEGIRQITAEDGAAAAQLRYVLVRDKVGDKWPIASYREFADDPVPTAQEMLEPLAFLVGDWVDESPEGRTAISYRWSEDGNFLLGDYVLSVGGQPESKSSQRIGWDPVEGVLRSWTFDSDGGFSQGELTPVDDGWVVKTEATMPDASTASATVLFTVKDQDHFVVLSTDRIVAGGEEPDFELVIARKPPQPGAAPAKPAAK